MSWLYYLLEANLYLAAFYLLYKLLLQHTTFYQANRYFLVLSIVMAFIIPLIQLGFLKPPLEVVETFQTEEVPQQIIEVVVADQPTAWSLNDYLLYGYLALAIGLSFKFLFSISKIIRLYFKHQKRELGKYTLVELSAEHAAFSFFNVLFIHPSMAKNNAVLTHEMIHIKQKHSLDIILLELLKIICWFNPLVYFMKRDLTLLHEYIADESTTAKNISKHEYAMFLIENSMASYSPSLVNQFFNQSILKSRINMLNKEKTANWARLKYLLAVPLGAGLLCASTLGFSKSYGYVEIGTQQKVREEVTKSKQEKKTYYPKYKHDKNGNYISLEERLIVINGKIIADKNKYYGTAEADKIIFLNSADATKKYGAEKGKNGAVELYGEKVVLTFPPPIVKAGSQQVKPQQQDQVKYPPTYKPKNQTSFYPRNAFREQKVIAVDPRLIVINGKAVEDNSTFYGVINTEEVIVLNPTEAVKKYGNSGSKGAVEVSGSNVKKAPLTEPPPSLYKNGRLKFPPAIENPPKGKKLKKFPPPIVVPDQPNKTASLSSAKVEELTIIPSKKTEEIEIVEKKTSSDNGHSLPLKYEKYPSKKVEEITLEEIKTKNIEGKPVELKIKANNPTQKVKGIKLDETNGTKSKEIKSIKIEATGTPTKKVQGVKLGKVKSPATTTTKIAVSQQLKTGYHGKAWLLYKPQPVENKNDRC